MIVSSHEPVTEIVDELRRIVQFDYRVPMSQVVAACTKAAAEIEELRATVMTMLEVS